MIVLIIYLLVCIPIAWVNVMSYRNFITEYPFVWDKSDDISEIIAIIASFVPFVNLYFLLGQFQFLTFKYIKKPKP